MEREIVESKKTDKDRYYWFLILTCVGLYMAMMMVKTVYVAEIATIIRVFSTTKSQASMVNTYYFITYALTQFILAFLMNKLNIKKYLLITVPISVFTYLFLALFVKEIGQMSWLFLLNGIAQAGVYACTNLTLGKYLPSEYTAKANSLYSLSAGLAFALSYGVCAACIEFFSWKLPFYIFCCFFLIMLALYLFAAKIVEKNCPVVVGKGITLCADEGLVKLKKQRQRIAFVVCWMFIACLTSTISYGINNWVVSYLFEVFAFPESLSMLVTIVVRVMGVVGPIVAISLAKRAGNYINLMRSLYVIPLIIGFLMIFILKINIILSISLLIVFEFFISAGSACVSIMIFDMRTQVNMGSVSALTNTMSSLAAGVIPTVVGLIIDSFGWHGQYVFIFCVLSVLLSILTIFNLGLRKTNKKEVNAALSVVKNMERNLIKSFRSQKSVTLLSYARLVKQVGGIAVWTKALQTAIDENDFVYIPKGKYYLDDSIIISSNKRIKASKQAEIVLVSSCKKVMLRNKSVLNGSYCAVDLTEAHEENISIEGGIWSESQTTRLGYGKTGAFDEEDSFHGVTCTMLFSGVKNLRLKNMTFTNSAGFSVQIGRCENIAVENIRFKNCYADGVHINGFVKNGLIKNIAGEVGDDLVALNAYDWDNSTINNGPMENLRIENICAAATGEYKSFRIQAGVVPTENGDIDCYIRDLYIKNVKGVSVFKMYLQTPSYKEEPDGTKVGRLENITIDGVELDLPAPVDQMKNYTECDPLTGNFGAFELGSNISKLTIYNVKAKINKERYPTLHLITAGPKSSYLPEWGIELFDPYVVSETEEIVYKNIRVNGKKITDLRTEIKEVSFPDTMYEGQYGNGGSGRVKSVKNERKI